MTSPDPLAEFRTLPEDVRRLAVAVEAQGRYGKTNRLLIKILAAVSVVLLILTAVVVRILLVQDCAADRSKALSGPSTDRINLFFQAYTEAAGQIDHPLNDAERGRIVDGLLADRETFTVLPARAKLEDATDFQLLAYRDLIAALRANEVYNSALAKHPVCSFWGV